MTGLPWAEVIGDPIAHSKSPLIHGFWMTKLGIEGDYRATCVPVDGLAEFVAARREIREWRGCNVTIPHKVAVASQIDRCDDRAAAAGAVNCVYRDGAQLAGTNTDVDGILAALPIDRLPPGSRPCLIGTGGAARAALAAFAIRGTGAVSIMARDLGKAQALLDEFGVEGGTAALDDPDPIAAADAVVNATSLGMVGKTQVPPALLSGLARGRAGISVFDMVYAPVDTLLLRAARSNRMEAVDGLTMLIAQAARAFSIFFGAEPPREHDGELRRLLLE